ncbi:MULTISPECIES: hypothetical protein [unclassified Rhizobium]|uniref:hypothetical protein n=1 Tax=unclassified Rhizobium TaxID=2613769 RepID=UPI0016210EDD|nr:MULTISPECIES: hypothetical protein [unclassified Rhizobium]MBB3543208.1 hypothetical protein [Rhizobium sp. BK399]MCS3741780.1 hypothetical protein [Rhizobium sp. BK661]MCS4093493.1 hypothetical protein [Rhizobium sp. BK176]
MAQDLHPAATEHLPIFITPPGQTDYLFVGVVVFLILMILIVGNLYFQLHAVPERMAHRTSKVQMEVVAVLALISLFTHNHLFWIAGLLLAFIHIPDFSTPLYSIAQSLGKLSGRTVETTDDPALVRDQPPKSEEAHAKPEEPAKSEPQGEAKVSAHV